MRGWFASSSFLVMVPFPDGVAAIDLLAKNGAALSVLVRMSRKDPLSMREFELASRLPVKKARKLRQGMHDLGLVNARVVGKRGAIDLWEIGLTTLGRKIMTRVLEINELLSVVAEAHDMDD